MNFGSKYVYMYDHSDEEVMSDDEFEEGLKLSESDSEEDNEAPKSLKERVSSLTKRLTRGGTRTRQTARCSTGGAAPAKKSKKLSHWRRELRGENVEKPTTGKRFRRADTNVVSVDFSILTKPAFMHTGDAVKCVKCEAMMSHISQLLKEENESTWTCEFCNHRQPCDLVPEELPTKDDVTYLLTPAPSTQASGPSGKDDSIVVFCVDISGSMCVTKQVQGRLSLRGADRMSSEMQRALGDEDIGPQHIPGRSTNVTYISRLQSMQAAVDQQLTDMYKEYPDRRVALVAFNNEVCVYGDGTQESVNFCGDKLGNQHALYTAAEKLTLPDNVQNSRQKLTDVLFDLEEGGATALGPALLISVALASRVKGSKVVVCTDGLANIGLGRLDEAESSDEALQEASKFYDSVATYATDHGVSVSVTSIEGTDCKMSELGRVADMTNGQVNIVDPANLTKEFSNILSDRVIATNVVATFIPHNGLYVRQDGEKLKKVTRTIGNVTSGTEITFEYGVDHDYKAQKMGKAQKGKEAKTPSQSEAVVGEKDVAPLDLSKDPNTPGVASKDPADVPLIDLGDGDEKMDTSKTPADPQQDLHVYDNTSDVAKQPAAAAAATAAAGTTGGATAGTSSSDVAASKKPLITQLPFQVQVSYTDTDGMSALRVLTRYQEVTNSREKAEQAINTKIIGVHTAQNSAWLAEQGAYTQARACSHMNQRLMSRQKRANIVTKETYDCFYANLKPLTSTVHQMQKREVDLLGSRYSDSGSDDEDEDQLSSMNADLFGLRGGLGGGPPPPPGSSASYLSKGKKKATKESLMQLRKQKRDDSSSTVVFKGKKHSSSSFM